jgi:hypothetical protein
MANLNQSTSSISSSSVGGSSIGGSSAPERVSKDPEADITKAGFYYRNSIFLIEEKNNFIITEANQKFILDFSDKSTVYGESEITNKDNIT